MNFAFGRDGWSWVNQKICRSAEREGFFNSDQQIESTTVPHISGAMLFSEGQRSHVRHAHFALLDAVRVRLNRVFAFFFLRRLRFYFWVSPNVRQTPKSNHNIGTHVTLANPLNRSKRLFDKVQISRSASPFVVEAILIQLLISKLDFCPIFVCVKAFRHSKSTGAFTLDGSETQLLRWISHFEWEQRCESHPQEHSNGEKSFNRHRKSIATLSICENI